MARFKRGSYKAKCDLTGAIFNACDMRMTWDGLFVHKSVWYRRHPQDHVSTVKENRVPHTPRPEGTEQFIATNNAFALATETLEILLTEDGQEILLEIA